MNEDEDRREESTPTTGQGLASTCPQVQPLLFDYLSRELGEKQSEFIQNHLRHCPVCRKEAAELQEAVALLQADRSVIPPERVSKGVRARLERALLHPVLDWCYLHRRLVSWIAAIVLIGLLILIALLCTRYEETVTYWVAR